ncbi:MAG: leucine-rich repeat domain-containing protein [Treponema sp.]|nr:leucine-rich repeat domain-containing protein [Treponema sp.]
MKNKFLLLTSLLVLILSSCKNIEQDTSLAETTTVTFAADNTRSIYSKLSNFEYTYTIRGKAKSGATFQTDKQYTYNELSPTRFEIQKGTWDFTMNVFIGEEVIFTGTKSVTIDKSSVISIPVYATTGSTASLSVKLNFPQDKGVAKITAALYDSVTEADAGSALAFEAGYVTYKNDDVPAATTKILKFYLYDCQDVCIASYIEGVYLAAHDNVFVERTLSNVNTFAATVSVKDVNGDDVIDSGLLVKAVKGDKAYPMTAVSGTSMYTASLPAGTYDVYSGQTDTGVDLIITFINGGNTSLKFDYLICSLNYLASMINSLTEDSTIVLTGGLPYWNLSTLKDAINNSTYKVNLDLSQTTGLTSISGFALSSTKLSGITIPDSVTFIDDWAFNGCKSLDSINVDSNNANYSSIDGVLFNKEATAIIKYPAGKQSAEYTIPDSVTSIGDYAFQGCTFLSSVTISDSVTSIGTDAFYGCTTISSVTIPDSVTSIGTYTFYNCTSLSSVTIGDSVTTIGESAFAVCSSLSSVTISDSVTSIGDAAFGGCTSLPSLTIPDSVTSIGNYAFYGCTSLSSVTIGNSVTSIGTEAFYGCTSLSSVTIPDSVTSIGYYAFKNCTSLSSVTIGNSVTSIVSGAFYGCTELSSVTIGNSVTSIGYNAFWECTSLSSVTFNCHISFDITSGFDYTRSIYSVNIGDSVTSIDDLAFAPFKSLTMITVDSNNANYSSIDGVLFNKDATALITYPAGKQSAAYTIPDSVTSIGLGAFGECTSLQSVTIADSVTSIGTEAFYGCTSISSVTIPDSVTSIGTYTFYNCTSLSTVTIGDSVTTIGESAFAVCSSLSSVTIGDSVTSIGSNAFSNCTSLSSVTIPDSVTSIGNYAFLGCTSLSSVTIPDSVTSIGWCTFDVCSKLTSILFIDTTTWYRTDSTTNWNNKTGGTITNVTNSTTNATYFTSTYIKRYWYKLDE